MVDYHSVSAVSPIQSGSSFKLETFWLKKKNKQKKDGDEHNAKPQRGRPRNNEWYHSGTGHVFFYLYIYIFFYLTLTSHSLLLLLPLSVSSLLALTRRSGFTKTDWELLHRHRINSFLTRSLSDCYWRHSVPLTPVLWSGQKRRNTHTHTHTHTCCCSLKWSQSQSGELSIL